MGERRNLILTWKNISYTVSKKQNDSYLKAFFGLQRVESVQLLKGVNGTVNSGTLMAVLGPSGAGKTTLLATISRRIKGEATGDVFLNGESADRDHMIKISGFVPQQDLAVESLTVEEHMEFMARMKMDRKVGRAVRKHRIDSLLAELGLIKCKSTRLSSLSGGERKKVSLAGQLLTEPSVLFCDEATTGLDSFGAMSVVRTLRDVATRGRIVVCSLHQPASGLLDIFHEVLLLSAGRVAFQGPAADATAFFASIGLHCPPTFNSAEFCVSQLSVVRGKEAESYEKVQWICEEFACSKYGRKLASTIEQSMEYAAEEAYEYPSVFLNESSTVGEFKKIQFHTQLFWLVWRSYVDCKRNASTVFLNFATYMFIGLLLSTPYINVMGMFDQDNIQSLQGLIYLTVIETVFTFNYAVFYTFPKELPLLLRDIAAGLYSPAPYYVSKVAILIPGAIIQPILYTLLIYSIAGLEGGLIGFLYFVIPIVLCAISASAQGCFLSAAFKSPETASLLSVPIDFLTLMFSGVYLHLGNLPAVTSWLKYLSQFYYGAEAVSLTQWERIKHINCSTNPEEPCTSTGTDVLEKYGYEHGHYATDLMGLMAIFVICNFAAFLVIRHRSRKQPIY